MILKAKPCSSPSQSYGCYKNHFLLMEMIILNMFTSVLLRPVFPKPVSIIKGLGDCHATMRYMYYIYRKLHTDPCITAEKSILSTDMVD